jgi:poly(A) polymerase Pap1
VGEAERRVLKKEFRRAFEKISLVEQQKAGWSDVYAPSKFFQQFRHFLRIDLLAKDEEAFASFAKWAEMNMGKLLEGFEGLEQNITVRPRPQRVSFQSPDFPISEAIFVGLGIRQEKADRANDEKQVCFDLRVPVVQFVDAVSRWPDKERFQERYEMSVRHQRRKELPWAIGRRAPLLSLSGATSQLVRLADITDADFEEDGEEGEWGSSL